jgi:hypothetical protein
MVTELPYNFVYRELMSAVEALRDIASFKGLSKRQRINSERAITWLYAHGYPLEPGGYVPGKGFCDTDLDTAARSCDTGPTDQPEEI